MTIASILKSKGSDVFTVPADTAVEKAMRELKRMDVGVMVVSDDGRVPLGLMTEREILFAIADRGLGVLDLPVADIMVRDFPCCSPEDSVIAVMAMMTERRARYVPVLENGNLAGIVSLGDVVKKRLDEVQADANAMFQYITRTR